VQRGQRRPCRRTRRAPGPPGCAGGGEEGLSLHSCSGRPIGGRPRRPQRCTAEAARRAWACCREGPRRPPWGEPTASAAAGAPAAPARARVSCRCACGACQGEGCCGCTVVEGSRAWRLGETPKDSACASCWEREALSSTHAQGGGHPWETSVSCCSTDCAWGCGWGWGCRQEWRVGRWEGEGSKAFPSGLQKLGQ